MKWNIIHDIWLHLLRDDRGIMKWSLCTIVQYIKVALIVKAYRCSSLFQLLSITLSNIGYSYISDFQWYVGVLVSLTHFQGRIFHFFHLSILNTTTDNNTKYYRCSCVLVNTCVRVLCCVVYVFVHACLRLLNLCVGVNFRHSTRNSTLSLQPSIPQSLNLEP